MSTCSGKAASGAKFVVVGALCRVSGELCHVPGAVCRCARHKAQCAIPVVYKAEIFSKLNLGTFG
ncbi:hypothetical protein DPMN_112498 [Dreissena polymorpha]|uniref:Uncharacterized protein n=1 Tax=Dreissena polymorpha TaxID=45954 RepID=A0A9D4KG79_DREPO|nr:hypothetical protein DPMN_112498 [Dreissena polymorpha]